jgi:hypothetical protein
MIHVAARQQRIDNCQESALIIRVVNSISTPQEFSSAAWVEVSEQIPESFFAGLEDIRAGRVVDMERALSDSHPVDE